MENIFLFLLIYSVLSNGGAEVPIPQQVVPQGIESVNGSNITMGCAQPLVDIGGEGIIFKTCGNSGGGVSSYLFDEISPDIDTSASNWASQLVTARKNDATADISYDHVVLTFDFSPAVSLTSIELDLFLCPELNIGAPNIIVYGDDTGSSGLTFNELLVTINIITVLQSVTPSQSSCGSLSTVSIPLPNGTPYLTWYIVVSFPPRSEIEWVHVGEVRLLDTPADPDPIPSSTSTPIPTVANTLTSVDSMVDSFTKNAVTITQSLTSTSHQPQPTTVTIPGTGDCEQTSCSDSAVIAVSAVCLLLVTTLTTVILIQCLLMARTRKSLILLKTDMLRTSNEMYAEVKPPTSTDVPVTPNEAYGLHKRTTPQEEAQYEVI